MASITSNTKTLPKPAGYRRRNLLNGCSGDESAANCPAIALRRDGVLIPSQDNSLPYNQGYSEGFIGVFVPGPHTQEYLCGRGNGTEMYQIITGYGGQPSPPGKHTSDYIPRYKQAKHFHTGMPRTIKLPVHTEDKYLHYYIGFQDGMVTYDLDRDNSDNTVLWVIPQSTVAVFTMERRVMHKIAIKEFRSELDLTTSQRIISTTI